MEKLWLPLSQFNVLSMLQVVVLRGAGLVTGENPVMNAALFTFANVKA